MMLSVVTTLYRSAAHIDEFYRRAMASAEQIADQVELIVVNDGSPDDSCQRAIALHRDDPRVVVIDLSRNFGHHKAMMTGLAHARGDLVFLIDSDLEERPELLSEFFDRMRAERCDVVYGVQQSRRGSAFERWTGALFFKVVDMLSDQPLPRNLITARLMTSDYVRQLVRHRDREFVISHIWQATGFRQVAMPVHKLSLSPTNYSLRQRLQMAVKHITTSSTKLLHIILYTGLTICALSVVVILFYLARYFLMGVGVDGWTSLIVSVWFFGGSTTLVLGILGIYMATLLSETKRRPYTVIRRLYRAAPLEAAAHDLVDQPGRLHARAG